MTLLDVEDVVVEYRPSGRAAVTAVAGASLHVEAGEVLGLVGESGCGKSSLGRAIVGLQARTRGEVTLSGQPVSVVGVGSRPAADRALQMVFQDPYSSLNPRRRVGSQIADGIPGAGRAARRRRVLDLLGDVGLPSTVVDGFPHQFSGGQRQRLAIARALASDPSVIVADEPVSALDASTRAQVTNLFVKLVKQRHMGLLFISHDLAGVRHMADRVAVMYLGRIVETAPTVSLWDDPLHPYSSALMKAIPQLGRSAARPTAPSGEVPDPASPPSGCRFHPRCPAVHNVCRTTDPVMVQLGPARATACWLHPGDSLGSTTSPGAGAQAKSPISPDRSASTN